MRDGLPYASGLASPIDIESNARQHCAVPDDRHAPGPPAEGTAMRALIWMIVFLLAPAARAQQVYKCISGVDVSYQSAPCAAAQTLVRQWEAVPEPAPTAAALRLQRQQREQARANSEWLSRAAGHAVGTERSRATRGNRRSNNRSPALSRCDAAKARRESRLKSVGLKRTFDLLRKLDDSVHEACRQ